MSSPNASPDASPRAGAPQRVLLLHNRYRAAGGEERVVDELETLLIARGHAVARWERESSEAGRGRAAHALLRGGLEENAIGAAVRAHRADVVHAHNLHPLLGWRALAAARAAGARTVLHLHNYRLFCAIGVAFRDGAPCYSCQGRNTLPGLRHRCRGSLPEAVAYAAGLARQQPHLLAEADALVAVSGALADRLGTLGLPRERTTVLLNFVRDVAAESHAAAGTHVLVAGRLVPDKGFDIAVRAARAAGVPLRIAGAGPEEARLRALADGADVQFLGQLDRAALALQRRTAAVLFAPSRSDDPCPMSVVEALADGVPVLASDRGGLPELVGSSEGHAGGGNVAPGDTASDGGGGLGLAPGGTVVCSEDPAAWADALLALWSDPSRRAARGAAALARIRARHTPEAYYDALMGVYGQG